MAAKPKLWLARYSNHERPTHEAKVVRSEAAGWAWLKKYITETLGITVEECLDRDDPIVVADLTDRQYVEKYIELGEGREEVSVTQEEIA